MNKCLCKGMCEFCGVSHSKMRWVLFKCNKTYLRLLLKMVLTKVNAEIWKHYDQKSNTNRTGNTMRHFANKLKVCLRKKCWVASFNLRQLRDYDSNWILFYLHHEDHSVQCNHDEHRVLKRGRRHEMPQSVLEGLSVLGHVARHWLGADGKVNASPLMGRNKKRPDTQSWGETFKLFEHVSKHLCI